MTRARFAKTPQTFQRLKVRTVDYLGGGQLLSDIYVYIYIYIYIYTCICIYIYIYTHYKPNDNRGFEGGVDESISKRDRWGQH